MSFANVKGFAGKFVGIFRKSFISLHVVDPHTKKKCEKVNLVYRKLWVRQNLN